MAITPETIREILSFNPGEDGEVARPFVDLGEIGPKTRLVYGVFPYHPKVIGFDGQLRKLPGLVHQPVLCRINGADAKTLVYPNDIKELGSLYGEGEVNKVLERVRERTCTPVDSEPVFDPWEGHDDF